MFRGRKLAGLRGTEPGLSIQTNLVDVHILIYDVHILIYIDQIQVLIQGGEECATSMFRKG
jgi:hypothetical protein